MEQLLQLEAWQLGLLGLGVAVGLGLTALSFRFGIVLFGVFLFAAAIGMQLTWNLMLVRTIITQLQLQRSALYMASGGLLLLCGIFHLHNVRWGRVSGIGIMLLITGVYAGLIRMLASDFGEGAASIAFAAVTLFPLAFIVPSLIRDWDDMYTLPRVIGVVGGVWSLLCMVQFAVNRRALTTGYQTQRFVGMLGNPQHAATYLCFTVIICTFLLLNDPKSRYKLLWLGISAVSGVLLLWTASRTGIAMAAIGVAACFYGRPVFALALLPVAAAIGFAAFSYLSGEHIDFDVERLTGGGQTRAGAWRDLLQTIANEPFFGNGGTGSGVGKGGFRAEKSENSLLYGMASYGVGMGLIIIVFFLVTCVQILKLVRVRWRLSAPQRRFADLLIGCMSAFWAGSIFEGYVVGRVGTPLVFMGLFGAMASRLHELHREDVAYAAMADGAPADSYDPETAGDYANYPDYQSPPDRLPAVG